jgi:hypothetical protein
MISIILTTTVIALSLLKLSTGTYIISRLSSSSMRFMNTLIEIKFYDVTLVSHFVFTLDKASSEKILLMSFISSSLSPLYVVLMGNCLRRGMMDMKKKEFSGYLRKFSSFSLVGVSRSLKSFY